MSPSNAHTERMVKAMNNIKTIPRSSLGQTKLNNQFKVAMNSKTGEDFDPQPFVDHWIRKSVQANEKREAKIVLQCGTEIPSIFKIKSTYKPNRSNKLKCEAKRSQPSNKHSVQKCSSSPAESDSPNKKDAALCSPVHSPISLKPRWQLLQDSNVSAKSPSKRKAEAAHVSSPCPKKTLFCSPSKQWSPPTPTPTNHAYDEADKRNKRNVAIQCTKFLENI